MASPMIFPHGYANTPAISQPLIRLCRTAHGVLRKSGYPRFALDFAVARLLDGSAEDMLVGFYESAPALSLPDGCQVLHGAVVLRLGLTTDDSSSEPLLPDLAALPSALPTTGAVSALKDILAAV